MLLDKPTEVFTSLRLTVVCLFLGMILVFLGTMAQEPLGLYYAQETFFRSLFVPAAPMAAALKKALQMVHIYLPPSTAAEVVAGSQFPVFPGGYLVGSVLVINLIAAQLSRFRFTRDKLGIWMVHVGLILLLLGQLLTDVWARESSLHLRDGDTKNYSENDREAELAIVDTTGEKSDRVYSFPAEKLANKEEVRHASLPFTIRVKKYFPNSVVRERQANSAEPAASTQGVGTMATVGELPKTTTMDRRDIPSAVIELASAEQSLGTWLVSEYVQEPQQIILGERTFVLSMRPRRFYKPFSIQLLEFRHDIYPGTQIPKNFSSRVRLNRPDTGESRDVLIYMNNPLRYAGETYYQASFDTDNKGTILQVVRNPSWLTPYLACVMVGLGLMVQFATHLLGFTLKRRTA
jgi:hypothetical protein